MHLLIYALVESFLHLFVKSVYLSIHLVNRYSIQLVVNFAKHVFLITSLVCHCFHIFILFAKVKIIQDMQE